MKRSVLVLVLAGLATCLAVAGVVYVQLGPYSVSGSHVIPLSQTTRPFYLTSVVVTFPTGSTNNTFQAEYVRAGVTNRFIDTSRTNMHYTLVWYAPNRLYMRRDDTLVFRNTDTNSAQLMINGEYEN